MIQVNCSKCNATYSLPDETAWKIWKCKCWEIMNVPEIKVSPIVSDDLDFIKDKPRSNVTETYSWMTIWLFVFLAWVFLWKINISSWEIVPPIFIDALCILIMIIVWIVAMKNNRKVFIWSIVWIYAILMVITFRVNTQVAEKNEQAAADKQKEIIESEKYIDSMERR